MGRTRAARVSRAPRAAGTDNPDDAKRVSEAGLGIHVVLQPSPIKRSASARWATGRMLSLRDLVPQLYELGFRIDVSGLLQAVRVPALVMHRTRTRAIPVGLGRELAAGIAGARFAPLSGVEQSVGRRCSGTARGDERLPRRADRSQDERRARGSTDMEESTATTSRLGDEVLELRSHQTSPYATR